MSADDRFPAGAASGLGPLQLWAFVFDGNRFKGEILPELERLKLTGVVRIVDLLLVRKDPAGAVATLTASDLDWDEATDFGAIVGGLVGWGAGGEEGAQLGALAGAAELADGHAFDDADRDALVAELDPGSSAALLLLEHLWAKPLRGAIERSGGVEVSNDWVRPDDLIALGMRHAAASDEDEDEDEDDDEQIDA